MYEDAKYFSTKEKLQETIDTYGVAIIQSLIDEKECEKMLSGMWDYFENITLVKYCQKQIAIIVHNIE